MEKFIKLFTSVIIPFALMGSVLTACDDDSNGRKGSSESRSIEITAAEHDASVQCNRFAWSFLKECMAEQKGNVVLSPISANICLSMLANGANGTSRAQVLSALGFGEEDMACVNSLNQKLTDQICNLDDNVALTMANSFWYDKEISPKENFIRDLRDNYSIKSYTINPETFIKDVNRWCNDNTNGLIPRILDDDASSKAFAFLNALYFKGYWNGDFSFSKKDTKKDEFHNSDGSTSKVDYMHKKGSYDFCRTDKCKAMRIPFGGGGFMFTVILPYEGVEMDECIDSFKDFEPATGRFFAVDLDVKLPKFKMSQGIDLIEVLKKMGVQEIFNEYCADFSNMTETSVFVDLASQKVSFEVNEEGAEAAAVTMVGGMVTTAVPSMPQYEPFNVDHPYIFMISERSTGAILFLGRINKF